MNPIAISLVAFVVLFASNLFGMWLHHRLPEHHRSADTKDSVRIGMGSVATVAALVLGLLIASTHEAYDAEKKEVVQMSAKIIYLDQLLVNYGPETSQCRAQLSSAARGAISRMWPEQRINRELPDPTSVWSQAVPLAIQDLVPQTDSQRAFKSQAADVANELGQMRWMLFEETESSIAISLIVLLIFWLALTFVSIGLFAPSNRIVLLAQLLASFSVAGAIFLILELDHPFAGVIKISSKPMLNAVSHLTK